jgi:hypothetical protein
MSQNVLVITTDDLDGTEGAATVTFGLDGRALEIDLTGRHAKEFRSALKPFTAAARVVPVAAKRPVRDRERAVKVRIWARKNGFEVGRFGRIPFEADEAFNAALRNTRTVI